MEKLEQIIEKAQEMEKQVPIGVLIPEANHEKGIAVTDREASPFTQTYNGQRLSFEESEGALKDRENSVLFYYER